MRIADALTGDGGKHLDHADDGAQKTEQRRYGGNRAQGLDVTLKLVNDVSPGILNAFLHDGTIAIAVAEPRRQNPSER